MLEAADEKFWSLVDRQAQPVQVVTGFTFTEGPVFGRRGYLLFSDMGGAGRILKWTREAGLTVFRAPSGVSNGLTMDHQGRLLACENKPVPRVTRTEKNGAITVLAGDGLGGPNDIVYAIDGNTYFTDLPRGRVYQIPRTGGPARVVATNCQKPNGVALSPNQQQLYVADSGAGVVYRYEIAADGALDGGHPFCRRAADGVKTDEEGNVWIASDGVEAWSAAGKLLGRITLPEPPSNLGWGEGFHGLYITARTSVYHIPTRLAGTRTY